MLKAIYEKYMLKYYKIIIVGGAIIILCVVGFIFIYHLTYQEEVVSTSKVSDVGVIEEEEPKIEEIVYYYADIKGAVVNPGVYQVEENARIIDVVNLAGGLTDIADTGVLNLSKKVSDEMVIIIYTKEEMNKFKEKKETKDEIIKYIEQECVCPDPITNGACNDKEGMEENNDDTLVSINSATKDELMTLPGIGAAKAQDIINYREANNGFETIDDIKNVKGIGDSIFDKIKDFITL